MTGEEWVTLPEGRLRVLRRGEGPARVFLPSLGGSIELYAALVDRLARTSALVVVEPFGAGASDEPEGLPSTRDLAEDVAGALDALSVDRFHLVGLSLGGMIAQHLAGLRPGRVRSLALASTTPRGLRGVLAGDVRNAAMARCLLAPDGEGATVCIVEDMLDGRASPSMESRVEEAIHEHPVSRAALMRLGAAAARHDGRDALRIYAGPARGLSGGLDGILPPDAQAESLELLDDARQVRFPNVGHDLALEVPDELARECDALMAEAG